MDEMRWSNWHLCATWHNLKNDQVTTGHVAVDLEKIDYIHTATKITQMSGIGRSGSRKLLLWPYRQSLRALKRLLFANYNTQFARMRR